MAWLYVPAWGGCELGLRLALGDAYRTVCHVERDSYAAAALVARMEDATLDQAPVWDDLATFDARPWRGVVDLVSAGFPCQPWSHAGTGKGTEDERWLWPLIARILREVRPSIVFLENVRGLLRGGMEHVIATLADLGFDAEWDLFPAASVGAPHLRERVFILAVDQSDPGERADIDTEGSGSRTRPREPGGCVADSDSTGHQGLRPTEQGGSGVPSADAEHENRTTKDAPSHGETHGRTLAGSASSHLPPTTSTDGHTCSTKCRRLNPLFATWLMGWPLGWTNPDVPIDPTNFAAWETESCRLLRQLLSGCS